MSTAGGDQHQEPPLWVGSVSTSKWSASRCGETRTKPGAERTGHALTSPRLWLWVSETLCWEQCVPDAALAVGVRDAVLGTVCPAPLGGAVPTVAGLHRNSSPVASALSPLRMQTPRCPPKAVCALQALAMLGSRLGPHLP